MSALRPGNPANDPSSKPVKGVSTFKPNYSTYQTMKFGHYTPHMAYDVVPKDHMEIRVGHDVDTFSLKAPVMTPIRMDKDYFFVPHRTILPNTSDLIITNPMTGDDVDALECNTAFDMSVLTSYFSAIISKVRNAFNIAPPSGSDAENLVTWLFHALNTYQLGAKFFSDGSLLNYMGISFSRYFYINRPADTIREFYFDKWFDSVIQVLSTKIKSFSVILTSPASSGAGQNHYQNESFLVELVPTNNSASPFVITLRELLEKLEDGLIMASITVGELDWNGAAPSSSSSSYSFDALASDVLGVEFRSGAFVPNTVTISSSDPSSPQYQKPRNYGRCVAYQIALAHFKTDDAIDFVWSANLWRQNQLSLTSFYSDGDNTDYRQQLPAFHYNGVFVPYDAMSGHLMSKVLNQAIIRVQASGIASVSGNNITVYFFDNVGTGTSVPSRGPALTYPFWYLSNSFNYQRSLRYRDYFCGSKTRPLAVGDVMVSTEGSSFSVVESIKRTQIARFLNQVNRVHRKLKSYYQGIFDQTPLSDAHDPIYFGSTSDLLGAEERGNTAAAQMTEAQTITSQWRNSSSRFAIQADIAEFGYLIGVTSFDVTRPYTDNTDRNVFAYDRFELFNPFMQHIGDQAVYGEELDPLQLTPFGYQLRYMEYKQKVDRAVGGFRDYLPGYAFLGDTTALRSAEDTDFHIRPDFIRSRPHELDKFYVALTNYSPAGYFHFIIRTDIECVARRPMLPAPSLL